MAQPTISRNVFTANLAGQGAGIYIYGDHVDPNAPSDPPVHVAPVITDNTFYDNQAIIAHGFAPPNANYPCNDHGDGGAIVGFQGVDPIITGNVIDDNLAAWYGGGIHLRQWSDGLIQDNLITNNRSTLGAGIHLTYHSAPTVRANVIEFNRCAAGGGGMYIYYLSDPLVEDNLISGNTASHSVGVAILYNSNPVVRNNLIIANNGDGVGVFGSSAPVFIAHNTIAYNLQAGIRCYGDNYPIITHNIITSNGQDHANGYGIYADSSSVPVITYNNLWDNGVAPYGPDLADQTGLNGNISVAPGFVDPDANDYHLNYDSLCIDAGDPNIIVSPNYDYDGDARQMGLAIDLGADEAYPVWNLTTDVGYTAIQTAIDQADSGADLVVRPGTYVENIWFRGRAISLQGLDPYDWDVVQNTVIDGNQAGSVVTLFDHEDANTILAGFTITNGNATSYGGGINIGNDAAPTVTRNIITDNSAFGGGGVYCGSGASVFIVNNYIAGNYATSSGGGVMINDEQATPYCTLAGNVIVANVAGSYGGGVCCWIAQATVLNNTIVGNNAPNGAGVYAGLGYQHTIANNIITDNITGCGMSGMGDPNSTLVVASHDDVFSNSPADYCGSDWTGLNGNFSADPNFADPGYWDDADTPADPNDDFFVPGDYHLTPSSACLDAGNQAFVPNLADTDFDREPRVFDADDDASAIVDVGADELFFPRPDTNRDGVVDLPELLVLVDHWLNEDPLPADYNGDLIVDLGDFALLARSWLWVGPWLVR